MRIGITPYTRNGDPRDTYVPEDCKTSIERNGGELVVFDYFTDSAALEALADTLDGVMFAGGPDVEPGLFGMEREPGCGAAVAKRDEFELALLPIAMNRRLPVLGICRGMQLINVCLGGTLIQDIPSSTGYEHEQPDGTVFHHAVTIEPGTVLAGIIGAGQILTNSYHHQSTLAIAPELIVNARSADGIIEGLEHPGYPFMVGVQWHPEKTLDQDTISGKLLAAFIDACRK